MSDNRSELASSSIRLSVDGAGKTSFSYDPANDRLTYASGRLSYGGHKVRIDATDGDGNTTSRSWSFKVVR